MQRGSSCYLHSGSCKQARKFAYLSAFPPWKDFAFSHKSCFVNYNPWIVLVAIYTMHSEKQETFWLQWTYSVCTIPWEELFPAFSEAQWDDEQGRKKQKSHQKETGREGRIIIFLHLRVISEPDRSPHFPPEQHVWNEAFSHQSCSLLNGTITCVSSLPTQVQKVHLMDQNFMKLQLVFTPQPYTGDTYLFISSAYSFAT